MRAWGRSLLLALAIRLAFILYGEWQDRWQAVKYTDIDYHVFNDAAAWLWREGSPFGRKTYRYTPLLAGLMLPGIWVGAAWGKLLFVLADLACGWHLYQLVKLRGLKRASALRLLSIIWLFNPMVIAVSTRGNAESILCTLIVASLYHLQRQRLVMAGAFLGAAVHFKLFPAIFALPMAVWTLYTHLVSKGGVRPRFKKLDDNNNNDDDGLSERDRLLLGVGSKIPRSTSHLTTPPPLHPKGVLLQEVKFAPKPEEHKSLNWVGAVVALAKLGGSALLVFTSLTGLMLWRFGRVYWEEAFWYHLIRQDHRHNFAPHFLPFYVQSVMPLPNWIGLAAFVPQLLALLAIGIKYGWLDVGYACFLQTVIFVTFNKVCTSQVSLLHLI